MTQDTLGPTPEWLKKHATEYEPPIKERERNRAAYRRLSVFETLHNRGEIEYCHLRAAEQLTQHVEGSMGYDVRVLDPWELAGSGKADEFPRTRHAKALQDAINQILPREWWALKNVIYGLKSIDDIGLEMTGAKRREIRRAHALRSIASGLERLAYHWDFISQKERV